LRYWRPHTLSSTAKRPITLQPPNRSFTHLPSTNYTLTLFVTHLAYLTQAATCNLLLSFLIPNITPLFHLTLPPKHTPSSTTNGQHPHPAPAYQLIPIWHPLHPPPPQPNLISPVLESATMPKGSGNTAQNSTARGGSKMFSEDNVVVPLMATGITSISHQQYNMMSALDGSKTADSSNIS
ncbi:hypothetical protein K469DRAFT_125584, partial [Zopfia rhizophila CBS 207.26]